MHSVVASAGKQQNRQASLTRNMRSAGVHVRSAATALEGGVDWGRSLAAAFPAHLAVGRLLADVLKP